MRTLVAHMQTTLDGRIARADGTFWEPFAWGDAEQDFINGAFRQADTWVMGRHVFEAVVPWWEAVARGEIPDEGYEPSEADLAFARILVGLERIAISRELDEAPGRRVIRGDIAAALRELKATEGRDIVLSAGPSVLGPLAAVPGLIDEYLVVVHPAVVGEGPRLFGEGGVALGLRVLGTWTFPDGAVVLRYAAGPRAAVDPAVPPSGTGCVACLASPDGWWLNLRRCAHCGHVGCCDSSPGRHAREHAALARHPIARSFEPGDEWAWDYEREDYAEIPALAPPVSRPADQARPGPADRLPPDWESRLHG
jgi:dihydrofolate reductase